MPDHIGAVVAVIILSILANVSYTAATPNTRICIVGSGISGSAAAHFLRAYSTRDLEIEIFEKNPVVGGRMATVDLGDGEVIEAGGTILHPKNYHAVAFTELLGLKRKQLDDDANFGIWNGTGFVFMTEREGTSFVHKKWTGFLNTLSLLWRYKLGLLRMNNYVSETLQKFLRYYEDSKPIFYTVEEMLKWADLYGLTQTTSGKDLLDYGLPPLLVDELITVIMRINYGQNMTISGMAGAVSLCGSGAEFWAVEGGNWKIAEGLIKQSNASLLLNEDVTSISANDAGYEVATASGQSRLCDAIVLATPLDENHIQFKPSISIPERLSQHTFTTFVRGVINPKYFGMTNVENVPSLIGTVELQIIPFSSINVLRSYGGYEKAYKIFSRTPMPESILDELFSIRNITVRLDWAAYPHYQAPESFAPFVLDGNHLYYINAFESAASTIETGAVAAENVARLLLSRMFDDVLRQRTENSTEDNIKHDL